MLYLSYFFISFFFMFLLLIISFRSLILVSVCISLIHPIQRAMLSIRNNSIISFSFTLWTPVFNITLPTNHIQNFARQIRKPISETLIICCLARQVRNLIFPTSYVMEMAREQREFSSPTLHIIFIALDDASKLSFPAIIVFWVTMMKEVSNVFIHSMFYDWLIIHKINILF